MQVNLFSRPRVLSIIALLVSTERILSLRVWGRRIVIRLPRSLHQLLDLRI